MIKKPWYQSIVHAAIGAAIGCSLLLAGRGVYWLAALIGVLYVAGFKEGSDAWAGRDTALTATVDALEIVAGGLLFLLIWQAIHS